MKNFTDLINEADSTKITSDYTRYLLEKQYFISRETARILLEEEQDDDGPQPTPFSRPFRGQQIYVHIDVDGRREIKVVNSLDQAKRLAQNFETAVAYDNGGDELNLREALEDGVDRDYTSSFKPQAKGRTKAPMSVNMPKSYEVLRAKLEKDIQANIADLTQKEEQIVGKGNVDAESAKKSAFWKAIYDDPSLASVLDIEEYEKSGFRADEPLHIRKTGEVSYAPSRELDAGDVKPSSRMQATGEAEGPVNPEDVADIKFVAPAHPSFEQKSGIEQVATKAGRWFEKPENIKTALSMGIGLGGGLSLAKLGLSAIPKVGPRIAPWLIGAGEVGLGGLYGMHLKQGIEAETEQAKKGKGVTVGQTTAGEAAAELPIAAAGAAFGGGVVNSVLKPRAPRPAELVEPKSKAPETKAPENQPSEWNVEDIARQKARQTAMSWADFKKFDLQKAVDSFEKMSPSEIAALQKQGESLLGIQSSPDVIPMPWLRPGLPGSKVRKLGGGSEVYRKYISQKEANKLLQSKYLTDAERNVILRASQKRLGTAIQGKVGERVSKMPTDVEKQVLDAISQMEVPPESITPEFLRKTRQNLGISGTEATDAPVTVSPDTKYRGFSLNSPLPLSFTVPKRPADFESPADYQRSKEEELGRALSDKEAKASAEEFAKDVREVEASKVSDRTLLFKDRGPVGMSPAATPSRASVISRIQQSPITKAAGVAASLPTVADMAAREAATIPAIVAKAIETTQKPTEPAGILRTAYRELKAPEVKVEPSTTTPSRPTAPKPTPSSPKAVVSTSGAAQEDLGDMEQMKAVKTSSVEDRSMDAIEASRLSTKAKVEKEKIEDPTKVETKKTDSVKGETKAPEQIPNVPAPFQVPDVTKTILAAIAAIAAGGGAAKRLKRTGPRNEPPAPKGGVPVPGEGGEYAPMVSDITKVGSGTENWDLMLKNIYGKYAGTLTK